MVLGPYAVFRGGTALFHSQQYFRSHAQEYGHAKRSVGILYRHAVSSMGNQASLESVR